MAFGAKSSPSETCFIHGYAIRAFPVYLFIFVINRALIREGLGMRLIYDRTSLILSRVWCLDDRFWFQVKLLVQVLKIVIEILFALAANVHKLHTLTFKTPPLRFRLPCLLFKNTYIDLSEKVVCFNFNSIGQVF